MKIRNRLTLQFVVIVASIYFISFLTVYLFSANNRKIRVNDRLTNRAIATVRLLSDVAEIDSGLLKIIDRNNPVYFTKEYVEIYNANNRLVYCNKNTPELKIDRQMISDVKKLNLKSYDHNGFEIVGIDYKGKRQEYAVFAGTVDVDGFEKLKHLRIRLITVGLLGILVIFIAGWFFSGRALSPISAMIENVNKISVSNIKQRLDTGKNRDEISKLAITFNQMLDRLENVINLQRKFLANASHELRTPLAAIMGQLEVALRKERDADYYKARYKLILDDIKSLVKTSNQLLALTKISSEESEIKMSPLRIDELVLELRTDFIKLYQENTVDLLLPFLPTNEKQLLVNANEALLKAAFLNLMDNGCKFSENKKVILGMEFLTTSVIIKFTDEGIGIVPEEIENIFNPFFRGSNTNKYLGSGLGLSLVEKIILLHNGKISVESKLKKGSTFTVILPVYTEKEK